VVVLVDDVNEETVLASQGVSTEFLEVDLLCATFGYVYRELVVYESSTGLSATVCELDSVVEGVSMCHTQRRVGEVVVIVLQVEFYYQWLLQRHIDDIHLR
jgi:hypothetical protein